MAPVGTKNRPAVSLVRISSNYARLAVGLLCGLSCVRLLLELGVQAYGVIAFLLAIYGAAASVREVITSSFLPSLASGLHSRSSCVLRTTAGYCWVSSASFAVIAFLVMLGSTALLSRFNLPAGFRGAAAWFLVAKAAEVAVCTALAPVQSFCLTLERLVYYNCWIVSERLCDLLAAGAVWWLYHSSSPEEAVGAIAAYGALSALFTSLCCVAFSWRPLTGHADIRPRPVPGWPSAEFRRSLTANCVMGLSPNLYARADALVMNCMFGVFGSLVFGLANQLSYYIRQAAIGVIVGLDAVAARLSHAASPQGNLELLRRSTAVQASVVLPVAAVMAVHVEPILKAWLGSQFSTSDDAVGATVIVARLLLLGVVARALSDTWTKILAGSGGSHLVTRPLLIAAAANPALAVISLVTLPREWEFFGPAAALSSILIITNLLVIPQIVARHLGASPLAIFPPLAAPLIATVAATPHLANPESTSISLVAFSLVVLKFGCVYGALLSAIWWLSRWAATRTGGPAAGRPSLMEGLPPEPHPLSPASLNVQPPTNPLAAKSVPDLASSAPALAGDAGVYVEKFADCSRATPRSVARRLALDALSIGDWTIRATGSVPRPAVHFLLLHHVFQDEERGFAQLVEWLAQRFELVGYSEAVRRVRHHAPLRPTMAISFDDGLHSCLRASQIMDRYGAKGCFFVCPDVVGERSFSTTARFCRERLAMPPTRLLDWDDISDIRSRGHEIGGHTLSHPRVSELPRAALADEIGNCRSVIQQRLGECSHFAWPYGRFEDFTGEATRVVVEAGYDSCASGVRGSHTAGSQPVDTPAILRRESVNASWPLRHTAWFLHRSQRHPVDLHEACPAAWRPEIASTLQDRVA